MKRPKFQDTMVAGILGGLIGVTCMDISNYILWRNKKTEGLYGHLAGSMIMSPAKLRVRKNFLVGQLFHMTVGSSLGVGMAQLLKRTGKDHHLVKGVFLSVAAWGVLYNFGQKMGFYRMNPRKTKSSYAAILNHLIYGLATSSAVVALADSSKIRTLTKETARAQGSKTSEFYKRQEDLVENGEASLS